MMRDYFGYPDAAGRAHYIEIARGQFNHDPADACDPITETIVLRMSAHGMACALADHMSARLGAADATIENAFARSLADGFAPGRCGCEGDCCGHRGG